MKNTDSKTQEFVDALCYEQRTVAFLDVLGWASLVKESEIDQSLVQKLGAPIYRVSNNFSFSARSDFDIQLSQFSDSIIFSVKSRRNDLEFLTLVVGSLIREFLSWGFPVRGGITTGAMIHKANLAYGPALVRAHELESKHAIYPRVILDASLEHHSDLGQSNLGAVLGTMVNRFADGWLFVDYMEPPLLSSSDSKNYNEDYIKEILNPTRQLIMDNLAKYQKQLDIFAKYYWMARYFDSYLKKYDLIKGWNIIPV